MTATAEHRRMIEQHAGSVDWQLWGPYLSERAWGTVREDYSADGSAWDYLPHDHARSRAYRWNEDGLAGISDRDQYLCFSIALWNGADPILKERLFGLTNEEGNHGEDVKEVYVYEDATPTHSYLRMRYRYPQRAFPYDHLVQENARRGPFDPEHEITDTDAFAGGRFFDVVVEYAKAAPADIVISIDVTNHGPDDAPCWVLPTFWFRNTWSWGYEAGPLGDVSDRPELVPSPSGDEVVASHSAAGVYRLSADEPDELLITENETNGARIDGVDGSAHSKDAFHRYLIDGDTGAVADGPGTKAAFVFRLQIGGGESQRVRLRLSAEDRVRPFDDLDEVLAQRRSEADAFYTALHRPELTAEERDVQRTALAGLMWSKQLYYYDVEQWLQGDPAGPPPPASRLHGRNAGWQHLNNYDILNMPDAWEYPWYAAWDLAFHCVPLALIDPDLAKQQLVLLTREWYMHPNGQLPAYEWSLGDVNPPVHAWAAWKVYEMDGRRDRSFLEGVFHKLLINFTWWVNRVDPDGNNVFQGGFLGLDNVSVFDRSADLPTGGHIDQSDGTAWMGFYTLGMLRIALELAQDNSVYEDVATKFYEHFLAIARAMTDSEGGHCLWNEDDGFFHDVLHLPDGSVTQLGVRSLVGLLPLLAVEILEPDTLDVLPDFRRRVHWFLTHRPHLAGNVYSLELPEEGRRHLASILSRERLAGLLRYLLDEGEFLSPYGIRSLSRVHAEEPFTLEVDGMTFTVGYEPGESSSGLFGGNSNWRGPVWFPVNYLIIEALRRFHDWYGDDFRVECPTGSGVEMTLDEVADELGRRLTRLFLRNGHGLRPADGPDRRFVDDPLWRNLRFFHEYFDGDTGRGLGAGHQTGWTALVATLLQECGSAR